MEIKYFGQYLIEKQIITREQFLHAISFQSENNQTLGEYAVKNNFITKQTFDQILHFQLGSNVSFITAATKLNLIPPDKMEELLSKQISNNILLGEALVHQKILTQDEVDKHFRNFRAEQSILEFNILNSISAHKHSEIIDIILQSTTNLIRYLLDMQARIGGFISDNQPPTEYDYVVFQKITGDVSLNLELYLTNEIICYICSALLRKEINEINELSLDSAKEFINIITGYICSSLSIKNLNCDATIPDILPTSDIKVISEQLRVPFLLPRGIIEIRILFNS